VIGQSRDDGFDPASVDSRRKRKKEGISLPGKGIDHRGRGRREEEGVFTFDELSEKKKKKGRLSLAAGKKKPYE